MKRIRFLAHKKSIKIIIFKKKSLFCLIYMKLINNKQKIIILNIFLIEKKREENMIIGQIRISRISND